ncbi:TetR/AcrR family transcriptional regulator [Kineococcus sp. NBC_00420]|uniref:TetR/AcrR family transcriptional regulator n=1 Tax=Kineococcus sp. NBC_00420 TaxID=2903564 RepID=UPI002E1FBB2E
MTPTPLSRRERPAKPPLSRDAIVDVALRLMDADGLERLTMRKLAAALDTGPALLYVYVRNTAELHAAILDRLLLDLEPPVEGDWRERLVAQFSGYTELLVRHPGLARSLVAVRPTGPQFLAFVDRALGELHRGHVPARQAAWGVDLLLQLATATAAEQATRRDSPDTDDAVEQDAVRHHDGDLVHLDRVGEELFSGTGRDRLRWALRALLHGIVAVTPTGG